MDSTYASEVATSDELGMKVEALVEVINPALAADGGWVKFKGHQEGIVYLEMGGGCQGCAIASTSTMEGLRRIIKERIPEVTDVVDVTDHAAGQNPFYKDPPESTR